MVFTHRIYIFVSGNVEPFFINLYWVNPFIIVVLETIVLWSVGILLAALVFAYFVLNNQEISLRKAAEAQHKVIESVHDTMWKVIKEKANVSEKYRETFESIYPEIIAGRYKDSKDMLWIKEDNPDFDVSLYADLMQAIEVQRMLFSESQKRMVDIVREHDTLINSIPHKWLISNRTPIDYVVISSGKTKDVMVSRVDDETLDI